MSAARGRVWLLLAASAFFAAWLLMPGVGITDAGRIFLLVGAHRGQVLASGVAQLASAACYAPALVALASAPGAPRVRWLRPGAALLLAGAMGSAADAVYHLFAYEMTAPGVPQDAMLPVMARMQGPGLVWILPLVACFFAGTALLVRAAGDAGPTPGARRIWLGLGLLVAAFAALALGGGMARGRAVGLSVLALVSAGQLRVALSPLFGPVRGADAAHS